MIEKVQVKGGQFKNKHCNLFCSSSTRTCDLQVYVWESGKLNNLILHE